MYNEEVQDLLPVDVSARPHIGEDGLSNVGVHAVESVGDGMRLLQAGLARRSTAATVFNDVSSRSHAVFTVHLEQTNRLPDGRLQRVQSGTCCVCVQKEIQKIH